MSKNRTINNIIGPAAQQSQEAYLVIVSINIKVIDKYERSTAASAGKIELCKSSNYKCNPIFRGNLFRFYYTTNVQENGEKSKQNKKQKAAQCLSQNLNTSS